MTSVRVFVLLFFLPIFQLESQGLTAEMEAGMELPVSLVGVQLRLNFNKHLFGIGGIGYSPATVTQLLGDESYFFGRTNRDEAAIVGTSLEKALYLDFRLGYDFNREGGLYIQGGYSAFLNGGGSLTGQEVEGAVGIDLSSIAPMQDVHVQAVVHNLTLHLGYSWFFERFSIYLEGGIVKPIFVNATVEASSVVNSTVLADEAEISRVLESLFVDDIWIATTGLWLSYNF